MRDDIPIFEFRLHDLLIRVSGANGRAQLMNPDISSAIFTLSLSILILNSQCVEDARYVRVH